MRRPRLGSGRFRPALAGAAALLVLGPLVWFWQASLLPGSYSVLSTGRPEYGGAGAAAAAPGAAHAGTSLDSLVPDPDRPADVALTLTARAERFRLASGRTVEGFTLNGRSPGPTIRARVGQLVQVRLVNANVADGVTLHWHGLDVPNAMDGVAGVTQDAVPAGRDHTYRFVAEQAGTFWYHSHQASHEQVRGGLLGALVLHPAADQVPVGATPVDAAGPVESGAGELDVVALAHLYGGVRTVNGRDGDAWFAAAPGRRVRVRVINSDGGPMSVWVAGAPFRLVAVDGGDVHGPPAVRDVSVLVTAGGRADLEVTTPAGGDPVRVQLGGRTGVLLGGSGSGRTPPYLAPVPQPRTALDRLSYGTPAALPFDADRADRRFDYAIGRRPGFVRGRPGMFWTVNGGMFPDVPMFMVSEGDVVRLTVENHSGEVHPMHLHGHHAVVLSRNGVPATGSPWWVDSLNVDDDESYEIAFVADNPGIWMYHCHNLPHAREGLVAHLAYQGVSTRYVVGGPAHNTPE